MPTIDDHTWSMIFIGIGTFILLMDSLGFWRFDNVLMRMHAATKGSTLGIGTILVGTMIYFGSLAVVLKLTVLIMFYFLTAPVGAQAIARSAYSAVEVYNELRGSLQFDDLAKHYPSHLEEESPKRINRSR